jgi:radical SAM superfamily enzyme YgiQ (UPF0313 family)
MRIAIIKPNMFGEQASDSLTPLLFAILKPLTSSDIQLDFYDENIERLPKQIDCDAVALSVETFTAKRAYLIAADFSRRGIPVIMGGFHPSACPDEALEHADAIAIGDADDTWPQIVEDLKTGKIKSKAVKRTDVEVVSDVPLTAKDHRYIGSSSADLQSMSFDYSVFANKRYNIIGSVQFSRGCRYSCEFCSIHTFYEGSIRTRALTDVIADIKQIKQRYIFFIDDNLFANSLQLSELLTGIAPLRVKWICQISIDVAHDYKLLQRMRKAGCIMVLIGFESLENSNLHQIGKSANMASNYQQVIANIQAAGLMIYGTFVIGYDADTPQTAMQLADFAKQNHFAIANFNPLIPTPGTALFSRLQHEGRLLSSNWWIDEDYSYGATTFMPKNMSPKELEDSCREARFAFYGPRSIAQRCRGVNTQRPSNLLIYLVANLISRKEIHRKQGRILGEQSTN